MEIGKINVDFKVTGIYKITSPTGRVYIGQSKDIKKRWKNYHTTNIQKQTRIFRSINKHSVENHIFEIIEECLEEDLNCRERYWQDFYDVLGNKGLNLMLTEADGLPRIISEEAKKKMSKSHTGISVVRTKEHNKNISLSLMGHSNITEDGKRRLSEFLLREENPWRGGKHTEKTKKLISEKLKGRIITDEHKEKLWAGLKRKRDTQSPLDNPQIKIIMSKSTGIFYYGLKDAAKAYNMNYKLLSQYLIGSIKKEIDLIYV